MNKGWKIIYYENSNDKPIYDFIESLELKAKEKLFRTFDLLEEFGLKLGMPHVKKLSGTSLWELRILGEDSIRIFYITMESQKFLLLHGFKKKKQKTPAKEIKIALERLKSYR